MEDGNGEEGDGWHWWVVLSKGEIVGRGGDGHMVAVAVVGTMDELQSFHALDSFLFILFLVQWMDAEDNSILGYL